MPAPANMLPPVLSEGRARAGPPVQDLHALSPPPARSMRAAEVIRLLEWGLALIMTAIAVAAHILVLFNAGHLWRDEAVSIVLSTSPTVGSIWRDLQTDSFPLIWPLLLRQWAAIVGAGNDQGLRVLGCIIGLTLLGVLWFNARQSAARVPLLGLAFLGLHSAVVCYGDSIRGYGLGIVTGTLTVAMLWRAVRRSNAVNWILAFLIAFVSVHCVFHNAPFLFASCSAAAAVLLLQKRPKLIILPMGIGIVCALSMVPYSLTLGSAKEWTPIFRYPMSAAWMWFKINEVFNDMGSVIFNLAILAVLAASLMAATLFSPRTYRRLTSSSRELLLFSGVVLVVGVSAHIAFLWVLSYAMNPWYFLTTLAIAGIALDGIASAFPGLGPRLIRLTVAGLVILFGTLPLFKAAHTHRTSVNLAAAQIQQGQKPGDVVIVNCWWLGYTFEREYTGKATWITIPPLPFPHAPTVINQVGLKRQMQHPNQTMPLVIEKVRAALRNGNQVWVVGDFSIPEMETTIRPAPAFTDSSPHKDGDYYHYWMLQLGESLRGHARQVTHIKLPSDGPVSSYEDPSLYEIDGWKD